MARIEVFAKSKQWRELGRLLCCRSQQGEPAHPWAFPRQGMLVLVLGSINSDTLQVACQTIAFGRGVCGTAASTRSTQLVPDVDGFPGHIACDSESASEIVVPIVRDNKVSIL